VISDKVESLNLRKYEWNWCNEDQ